ncbi:MAG: HAD family hydrolase [Myxococcota bacterium]
MHAPRGIIFDMDGTLIEPEIDFAGMRRALGIPTGDLLHTIATWGSARQAEAHRIIEEFELDAASRMELRPGALELFEVLDARDVPRAIVTRNMHEVVEMLLAKTSWHVDIVLDRTFTPPKPNPASAQYILERWRLEPARALFVGDSTHDLRTARAAGVPSCLIKHQHNEAARAQADRVIDRLDELCALF